MNGCTPSAPCHTPGCLCDPGDWDDQTGTGEAEQTPPLDLYAEMAAVADTPDDQRPSHARDLIRRISGLPAEDRQTWRDAIRAVVPGITKADFDSIVREERRAQKEKAKEAAREARVQQAAAVRAAAEAEGELLPDPADPMAVARTLAKRITATDGAPHLTWWRGDFYQWTGARWAMQQDSAVMQWLYRQTENAIYDAGREYKRWAPTSGKVGNLREALGVGLLARSWEADDEKCIAVANGIVDTGRGRALLPHTPRRFNLASLPFDYDHRAQCPQWVTFLGQILPEDKEAQQFLQEWFGYVISGRTDLQKMADLYGPRRCGKGTIARVLEALLGPEAVAAPSLPSLAGNFGEQPLIGKSLAVMSDVNWGTRDVAEAVEVLKKISGEDSRDVNRKNREAWHGKLGVRFMILGNDMPKFTDASGALAGRMIHIPFRTSFFGREDPKLTGKLMDELPGILNWSLDGLERLNTRGRFKPPTSSADAEDEIMRLTSPVFGFISDRAVITPNAGPVLLDDLYAVYKEWCGQEEGRERISTKEVFSRDLRSVGNGAIVVKREKLGGVRARRVYGLREQEAGYFTPKTRWAAGI
jgi:putative DNA primase/helicase